MSALRRVVCVGGGPAGLYCATLLKRAHPSAEVVVHEQSRPGEALGWGVVLSAKTVSALRAADARTFALLEPAFVGWQELDVRWKGERRTMRGHHFVGVDRGALFAQLARAAVDAGVELRFGSYVDDVRAIEADLVVICDGARSRGRAQLAERFEPTIEVADQRYFWVGSEHLFDRIVFAFEESEHGLFQAHGYPHSGSHSTLSFVVSQDTVDRAGFMGASPDVIARYLERVFAPHLGGKPILTQKAVLGRFRTVSCKRWVDGRFVLMGDAAHTAHFTIGSGTKMALEDAIALRDALRDAPSRDEALHRYETTRRPEVQKTQAAAASNLNLVHHPERYRALSPDQFAFRFVTRTGRFTCAEADKRDRAFVDTVRTSFSGGEAISAWKVPAVVGGAHVPERLLALSSAEGARRNAPRTTTFEVVSRQGDRFEAHQRTTDGAPRAIRGLWIDRDAAAALDTAIMRACASADADVVVVEALGPGIEGAYPAERVRLAIERPVMVTAAAPSPDFVETLLLGGRADLVLDTAP